MANIVKELKGKSNNYGDVDSYAKNKRESMVLRYPIGLASSNILLNNLGYRIPLKLILNSNVLTGIKTKVTNYGINNALVEINIVLELKEQVILPFISNKIDINTSIPVAIKLIQGSVPNYYLSGINGNSASLTLPVE